MSAPAAAQRLPDEAIKHALMQLKTASSILKHSKHQLKSQLTSTAMASPAMEPACRKAFHKSTSTKEL